MAHGMMMAKNSALIVTQKDVLAQHFQCFGQVGAIGSCIVCSVLEIFWHATNAAVMVSSVHHNAVLVRKDAKASMFLVPVMDKIHGGTNLCSFGDLF